MAQDGIPGSPTLRRASRRQALLGTLVAALVLGALNADGLANWAGKLQGPWADAAAGTTGRLADETHAAGLDRPYGWVRRITRALQAERFGEGAD